MKKIILLWMMMMMVLLSLSVYSVPINAEWGKCPGSIGSYFQIDGDYYDEDYGVNFMYGYDTWNARSTFRDIYKENVGSLVNEVDDYAYGYGWYNVPGWQGTTCIDLEYVPYKIYSCFFKCDADGPVTFEKKYYSETNRPFSKSVFHSGLYSCDYGNASGMYTVEAGCVLILSEKYSDPDERQLYTYGDYAIAIRPSPDDLGFNSSNVLDKCTYNTGAYCEQTNKYDCSACSIDDFDSFNEWGQCVNNQETCPCCKLTDDYISCNKPAIDNGWSDDIHICSSVVVDAVKFTFNIDGDTKKISKDSAGTDDPTDPYEGGDNGGDVGGDTNEDELQKQVTLQNQIGVIQDKSIVLTGILDIAVMVFSLILIIFYVLEIAITVYVFIIWIPAVFKAIVDIFRKIGGV